MLACSLLRQTKLLAPKGYLLELEAENNRMVGEKDLRDPLDMEVEGKGSLKPAVCCRGGVEVGRWTGRVGE